jgi:dsRNA-specific ribonuclease
MNLDKAQRLLGYTFHNPKLLEHSIVLCNGNCKTNCYSKKQLSFYGDALIRSLVAKLLLGYRSNLSIDEMSEVCRLAVNNKHLSHVFQNTDIGEAVKLVNEEVISITKERTHGNYIEGILGAIYIDGGEEVAYQFVTRFIFPSIKFVTHRSHRYSFIQFKEKFSESKEKLRLVS